MRQLWAPWRMAYVAGDESRGAGCFLCEAGAQPAADSSLVVERAPLTVTLLNRYPYSTGHVLVAPLRHLGDLAELAPEEDGALMAAARRALAALRQALRPEGFNLGVNLGAAAGASIEHLHLHVVPRWSGDTNFMPVLGDVKVLPEHLSATAETLRSSFADLEAV